MLSLLTVSRAQNKLAQTLRARRLDMELTQAGLATRSGVKLRSLRKFEQKGLVSLESFLKLAMALGCLEEFVNAAESAKTEFTSIDDVLTNKKKKQAKKGWRNE